MAKWLFVAVAAWLALGAAAALADVTVTATIDKTKDIRIIEDIAITKTVDLDVVVTAIVDKAAESDAHVNQVNEDNEVCQDCAEKRDRILESVVGNSGILSLNQAAGNMNNQGNAVSVAVDTRPDENGTNNSNGHTGFAEAQAAADQRNEGNTVETVNVPFRTAEITGSINRNTGIVHVNQAVGNMNNQANVVSVALALDGGVALAEADLGQFNTGNTVAESNVGSPTGLSKTASITDSVNGNTGIVGVNQSGGNMANQANVVAVGAAASF